VIALKPNRPDDDRLSSQQGNPRQPGTAVLRSRNNHGLSLARPRQTSGTGIRNSISYEGWPSVNPMRLKSPGLMTDVAGIGYASLRLAEPERVPSVLPFASARVPA
jgi:hypothetical protein